MTKPTKSLAARVAALRAAARASNAAAASMLRAAAASNPDRMLRCWTAQARVRAAVKGAK